jgi:hypothetical protein
VFVLLKVFAVETEAKQEVKVKTVVKPEPEAKTEADSESESEYERGVGVCRRPTIEDIEAYRRKHYFGLSDVVLVIRSVSPGGTKTWMDKRTSFDDFVVSAGDSDSDYVHNKFLQVK